MKELLKIDRKALESINRFLLSDDNAVIEDLVRIVEKHGGPRAINAEAAENGKLEKLMEKVRAGNPRYADDLEWLIEQRDGRKFISVEDFRREPALRPGSRTTPIR